MTWLTDFVARGESCVKFRVKILVSDPCQQFFHWLILRNDNLSLVIVRYRQYRRSVHVAQGQGKRRGGRSGGRITFRRTQPAALWRRNSAIPRTIRTSVDNGVADMGTLVDE